MLPNRLIYTQKKLYFHTRLLSLYSSLLFMVVFDVVFKATLLAERFVTARDLTLVFVMIDLYNQFLRS